MLKNYLSALNHPDAEQSAWYASLRKKIEKGAHIFETADQIKREQLQNELRNRMRTEELKAWYSAPEGNSLFQGTSISSLTIPYQLDTPLPLQNITDLETNIADAYIHLHNKTADLVKKAIIEKEEVDKWIQSGLFYGVVIASKVISQAFGLSIHRDEVVFQVGKHLVDPHEITTYPQDVREKYFEKVVESVDFFNFPDLRREEIESSLVLADISKPHIEKYQAKIILAPIRCNEIACLIARGVKKRIREKSHGAISPRSLAVVIYDTDTPYTYHHLLGDNGNPMAPIFPGLIVLGASGTIDAFRWLYTYRTSLIAQKIQKGSLYSETHRDFIPFVFYGVLVPRDAEILLDMDRLDVLRYRGNLSAQIECSYILPSINDYLQHNRPTNFFHDLHQRLK